MAGSQADQVCYLKYPATKRIMKPWLTVLQVNPRNRVQGKFGTKDLVILQQTNDDTVTKMVDEIDVNALVEGNNPIQTIDFEIEDNEQEDEFLCNLSSSEEDNDEDRDGGQDDDDFE